MIEVGTGSVGTVDQDGDELRIELAEDGRIYVTASQENCTATVGPFTRVELEAMLELTGGGR